MTRVTASSSGPTRSATRYSAHRSPIGGRPAITSRSSVRRRLRHSFQLDGANSTAGAIATTGAAADVHSGRQREDTRPTRPAGEKPRTIRLVVDAKLAATGSVCTTAAARAMAARCARWARHRIFAHPPSPLARAFAKVVRGRHAQARGHAAVRGTQRADLNRHFATYPAPRRTGRLPASPERERPSRRKSRCPLVPRIESLRGRARFNDPADGAARTTRYRLRDNWKLAAFDCKACALDRPPRCRRGEVTRACPPQS